jgi:hypothetical protein
MLLYQAVLKASYAENILEGTKKIFFFSDLR